MIDNNRKNNIQGFLKNENFKMIIFHGGESWEKGRLMFPEIKHLEYIITDRRQHIDVYHINRKLIIKCYQLAFLSDNAINEIVKHWNEII